MAVQGSTGAFEVTSSTNHPVYVQTSYRMADPIGCNEMAAARPWQGCGIRLPQQAVAISLCITIGGIGVRYHIATCMMIQNCCKSIRDTPPNGTAYEAALHD